MIARITLGTGTRANVLTTEDWKHLEQTATELAADETLRVVIISGTGRSAFSAGSDMREWVSVSPDEVDASFAQMEAACAAVERIPVPVIAVIRGVAAGAGCQLACACDLRIIGERAQMGMPIARWGILVSTQFATRLSLLAGPSVARDLLYTGRLVTGPEAVSLGLATRCVREGELSRSAEDAASLIAAQPASAVRAAKRAVDAALAPLRSAAAAQPPGPAADYRDLQHGIRNFLRPAG